MKRQVDQNVVEFVADFITDDAEVFSEGLLGSIGSLFGGGGEAEAPAQEAEPAQAQSQGFQFSTSDFQSAEAFTNTIINQLPKVLGNSYVGGLRQATDGMSRFKKAVQSYWGRAGGVGLAKSLQGTGAESLTQPIKDIADDVMNETQPRRRRY